MTTSEFEQILTRTVESVTQKYTTTNDDQQRFIWKEDATDAIRTAALALAESVAEERFTRRLNRPQREDIYKLAVAVRGMHNADIKVRNNGQDLWFEADWLKYLMPIICPQEEAEFQHRLAALQAGGGVDQPNKG